MQPDGSQTQSERVRAGIARARQRRRLKISHAMKYPAVVAEPIRPIVASRAHELAQLVSDLGGENELSAAQVALARRWAQISTVAEVAFGVWLADGAPMEGRAIDKLIAASNSEARILATLGLERRERPVESLSAYLQRRTTGIAEDARHSPIASEPESEG